MLTIEFSSLETAAILILPMRVSLFAFVEVEFSLCLFLQDKEPMPLWQMGTILVDSVIKTEALLLNSPPAWKIAHVLRGWSSPRLLSTYETERRTFALDLIEFDKKLAQMMNRGDASEYAK